MTNHNAAAPARVCLRGGCNASLDGKRSQARFCSPAHRAAHHRESGKKPFSTAPTASRRASREGNGTHIYVTPSEVDFLQHCRVSIRHVDDWEAQLSLGKKLVRAKGRLR